MFSLKGRRIWVAGHRGMVGGALVRRLQADGHQVITAGRDRVDMVRQTEVEAFVAAEKPDVVVIAAARVGGIAANAARPVDFLYDNLMIEANIMAAAASARVAKLLFLGSSCIYPRLAPQPMAEDALLTGPLEETNQWYAVAKIAGIKLAEAYRRQHGLDFISAMPTNLYGPGDNYDLESSHVIPALLRKAIEARDSGAAEMVVWGSGTPLREFMHVDDLADALVFLLEHYSEDAHINVGSGIEVTIAEVAQTIADTVGFKGQLVFDRSRPDGTPRKLMDSQRLLAMGWRPRIGLRDGLADAHKHFLESDRARFAAT
jgi:GDP-L-fucose synthase